MVERSKAETSLKGRGQSFGSENLVNDSSAGVSVDLQGQGQWRVVGSGIPQPTIRKLCRDSMDFVKSRGGWGVAPRGNCKHR